MFNIPQFHFTYITCVTVCNRWCNRETFDIPLLIWLTLHYTGSYYSPNTDNNVHATLDKVLLIAL